MKNFPLKILDSFSFICIGAAVIIFLTIILTPAGEVPSIGGFTALRILTGSMAPELEEGTLIIVQKTDPAKIQVGDIISFYSEDPALGGSVNTHRVVEIASEDGKYVYTTKGDANAIADSYTVSEDYLIGKVVFNNHLIGRISQLVSNPLIYFPIIVGSLVLVLVSNIRHVAKTAKQIYEEEEKMP